MSTVNVPATGAGALPHHQLTHMTSLRVYGAILLAFFLVFLVVNTVSVHRQQRELAQHRQQELRDKMHNRHKNHHAKKKYVQTHGVDSVSPDQQQQQQTQDDQQLFLHGQGTPSTTDEKMGFGSSSSSQTTATYEQQQQQTGKRNRRNNKNKKMKWHDDDKRDENDQKDETATTTTTTPEVPKSLWQRIKSWFSHTSAPANATTVVDLSSSSSSSGSGSSSSNNENGGNSNQNSDVADEDGNMFTSHKKDSHIHNFYSGYSTKQRDGFLGEEDQQPATTNDDEDLKQQVEKLKAQQDDLRAQLDEKNIHQRRRQGDKKKKTHGDDDDEDQDEGKGKINIKINLNTNNKNNEDDEDDDQETNHHHNRRRKHNHHLSPREKRQRKYFNKKFGEGDLTENNYDRGAGGNQNLLDMEDQQVLDQANRQVDHEKEGGDDDDDDAIPDSEEHFDEADCPGYPSEDGLPFVPYQKLVDSGRIYEPKYAYVTYITSAEFALPAAVLMFSIANTGSQYARVICVSKEISEHDRALLGLFAQIIEIEKIPAPLYVENARYRDTFTKLRMWQLEMFTKALYVDTDVIIKKNVDLLFDLEEWSVPMDAEEQRYSTGMMLLAPSYKTFAAMMYDLNTTSVSMELPDLLFLKEFFERRGSADGLKLDDVPALKSTTAAPTPQKSQSVGEWQWKDGKWTYVTGGNSVPSYSNWQYSAQRKSVAARGIINIIPRWFQVYHLEFGSQYHSYLTHRVQKLTINDPRIYGIHYPGNGKPWNDMAKKLRRFSKYLCHPEMPEAKVRWRYQPELIWFVYYSMMKRGLRKIEKSLVGSPVFETERGKSIILSVYVKEAERKRSEESKYYSGNTYNYNSYNNYNYNNNNNNNNNNQNYNNNANTNNDNTNNNNDNNNADNKNNKLSSPFLSETVPPNFDGLHFVPSACLVWNLTARAPPGVVLFEDDSAFSVDGESERTTSTTTTTSTATAETTETTQSKKPKTTSLAEKYQKMYERYYHKSSWSPPTTSTAAAEDETTSSSPYAWNKNAWSWNSPTTTTTTKAPSTTTFEQPQSFDDYILTSQARPIFDLSTLDPLVLSLPQRTGEEGMSWEKSERYSWYVTWCTRTIFKASSDAECGQSSFVSQFSGGVCRANFFEKFSIHRFGSVPKLLWIYQNVTSSTETTTTASLAENNSNSSSASSHHQEQREQQEPQLVEVPKELVSEYPRIKNGLDGVVIRSSVSLSHPARKKFVDVVIRCDWSMDSESIADFDLDHPFFNTSKKYFSVPIDTVKKPNNRRYRIFLKSRCACPGGCGLAKLWNETYYTSDEVESEKVSSEYFRLNDGKSLEGRMRGTVRDEWARNITGLEPTVDDLFPTEAPSTTALDNSTDNSTGDDMMTTTSVASSGSTASSLAAATDDDDVDDGGAVPVDSSNSEESMTATTTANKKRKSKNASKKNNNKKPNKKKTGVATTETPIVEGDYAYTSTSTTETTTTTSTSTTPPPPRTTKPVSNQTEEEQLHVEQVYEKFTSLAWRIINRNSSIPGCSMNAHEYGKVLRAEETSHHHRHLLKVKNARFEKHFCELASGNSLYGRCDFIDSNMSISVSGHQFSVRRSTCLPRYQQQWILVSTKAKKNMCNCTHVGGDADTSYTLEKCFAKAAQAGANVVNFGAFPQQPQQSDETGNDEGATTTLASSAVSSVEDLVLKSKEFKNLIESEKNFTRARDILSVAVSHLNFSPSGLQTFQDSELLQKLEEFFLKDDEEFQNVIKHFSGKKYNKLLQQDEIAEDKQEQQQQQPLSHAERAKLARKRRQDAAKKAKLISPSTTSATNSAFSPFGNRARNFLLGSAALTGKACYYKKCSAVEILQEKVSMKDTDDKSGDYYVFIKNPFFINATGSHPLLL